MASVTAYRLSRLLSDAQRRLLFAYPDEGFAVPTAPVTAKAVTQRKLREYRLVEGMFGPSVLTPLGWQVRRLIEQQYAEQLLHEGW
jgi:hypothetical protein